MAVETSFEHILTGVIRFQNDVYPKHRDDFIRLAKKQEPKVLFLTCADSRVHPNLITQTNAGDLFICRNIGNLVPPHGTEDGSVATVMEYAIDVLHVEHIVVCGHSGCGAMKSLLDPNDDALVPQVTRWLRFAEAARRVALALHKDQPDLDILRTAAEQNVIAQLNNLRTYPEVAARLATRVLQLHGWYYDIASGQIDVYDSELAAFVPIAQSARRATT